MTTTQRAEARIVTLTAADIDSAVALITLAFAADPAAR